LKKYRRESDLNDAVVCGMARIHGIPVSLAVMDFRFAGGSMGSVVGEKITRSIERAIEKRTPCIVFSASGGARMQEGILSLMQMAKTSAALAHLSAAALPFISVLTNPTTGGVTASFAVLGDVILAEPGALIGFAGPRVIKETTQQQLPEGFQSSEFLLKHGLVDQIVSRLEMRDRLRDILQALFVKKAAIPVAVVSAR
jgi:acetyl-CoA carboxylase carboxyl transferase subunit beta